VFIAALVMVAGLFARTFQEANSLVLPVMLLPLASAAIAVADPPTTAGLLVTPIANTTVLIRDLLTGRATVGSFLLASAASCLYAGLLVSAAARLFNTEQLVNPSWEPLKLRGFGKRSAKPRLPRPPSVDAALALFAVTLLLGLYSAPLLVGRPLLVIVVISMVFVLATPALLLAWVAGYPWVETFSFRKPGWTALAGGALVGIGIGPLVQLLNVLQSTWWPGSAESSSEQMKLFLPSVIAHPVLTAVVVGALAGLCEELLYRGPIQSALTRRLPATFGLFVTAALFSAAHMDAHGFPLRLLLGLVLGYVVWRGGSIFPAMLLHAAYDATQLAQLAWAVHTQGAAAATEQAVHSATTSLDAEFWLTFAVGTVLLVAGAWLFRRAWPLDGQRGFAVVRAP
jgi:sodium transport system permease protein